MESLDLPDLIVPGTPNGPSRFVHLFDDASRWAIRAALATGRPLLIRGEPGVGKSQIAEAAALALKRPLLSIVVNSRTESNELLYTFDAVQRLALAQIWSSIPAEERPFALSPKRFLRPGPLWWAFDWKLALRQAKRVREPIPVTPTSWQPGDGCVVLIDEIDKAESDLPNGLLEAFGSRKFSVRGRSEAVQMTGQLPLVILTTNQDRDLPNAFLRRCLVLQIDLPQENQLESFLYIRGRAHQPDLDESVVTEAAKLLVKARLEMRHERPRPGQAEFLDLLKAYSEIKPSQDSLTPSELLEMLSPFVFSKLERKSV